MDQRRLFRLCPPQIDVTIRIDDDRSWHLTITDRPAGVPWSSLEPERYNDLTCAEAIDVLCAHLADLA